MAFSTTSIIGLLFVVGTIGAGIYLKRIIARRQILTRTTQDRPRTWSADCPQHGWIESAPSRLREFATMLGELAVRYGSPFIAGCSIVVCWLPVLVLVANAFLRPSLGGLQWTMNNFRLMGASDQLIEALMNSAVVATVVAVGTVAIAFALSLVLWDRKLRILVVCLLFILALFPGDAYALTLDRIVTWVFGIDATGWPLMLVAQILWAVPFAAGTLLLANTHISEHVLESALEYGDGPLVVVLRIIGRISFGRIIGVALLAGTLSLNDYVRASYLGGSLLTVSNQVYGRLESGISTQDRGLFAAEFLVVAMSGAAAFIIVSLLQNRRVNTISDRADAD